MSDDYAAQTAALQQRYVALIKLGMQRDPVLERALAELKHLWAYKVKPLDRLQRLQAIRAMLEQPRLH
jgi:hypothetical protein